MRERVGCNFTGSYVEGFFRTPGMLHRAKYSRFRNDSLTSLDDPPTTASLRVKNSSSSSPCSPLTPGSPADELLAESGHAATGLCIPKMTNLKLSNPASLLGLKSLSLGAKEIARVKGTDTFDAQSLSSSALDLTSCFSAFPHPKQELHKLAASTMQFGGGQPVSQDWAKVSPHPRGDVLGSGALYAVRYMGCVEVLQSMRSLDFNTRTQVTREAISRVCEAVPDAKGAMRRRKPPSKGLSTILGKSNLQFSGMNIIMSISTNSLNLTIPHSKQIIANHHMQSISFASGGDPDTTDYVAYVAKDPVNQRACHIVECSEDLAQDVINTIGKAFELRFKQYLKNSPVVITPNERRPGLAIWNVEGDEDQNHGYYNETAGKLAPPGSPENAKVKEDSAVYSNNSQIKKDGDFSQTASPSSVTIYENYSDPHKETFIMAGNSWTRFPQTNRNILPIKASSRSDLFDDPSYMNTQNVEKPTSSARNGASGQIFANLCKDIYDQKQVDAATFNRTTAVPLSNTLSSMREQLAKEVWYRGRMSRQEAERLLIKDGDFLVRESVTTPEQYVLTGLQGGQAKHLLLVDPEGLVRTKDCIFDSVSHLISYHVDNQLPIISSGNQLYLKRAV
ncbi:SHC-transforming protein 1-like isoform X1 [Chiloscyllium plagiosum]|uniref:SHC-transforming protein 1-like isoform X1 n=3 Tax=Chiloscyllium plagiosum TaxID=36176 RepID=UPI001CB7ED0E|nr:SHC-transforming protein 1-like isoform X1 [Chiloscyllium plagiosum]